MKIFCGEKKNKKTLDLNDCTNKLKMDERERETETERETERQRERERGGERERSLQRERTRPYYTKNYRCLFVTISYIFLSYCKRVNDTRSKLFALENKNKQKEDDENEEETGKERKT